LPRELAEACFGSDQYRSLEGDSLHNSKRMSLVFAEERYGARSRYQVGHCVPIGRRNMCEGHPLIYAKVPCLDTKLGLGWASAN
jgi:hypothetical protein